MVNVKCCGRRERKETNAFLENALRNKFKVDIYVARPATKEITESDRGTQTLIKTSSKAISQYESAKSIESVLTQELNADILGDLVFPVVASKSEWAEWQRTDIEPRPVFWFRRYFCPFPNPKQVVHRGTKLWWYQVTMGREKAEFLCGHYTLIWKKLMWTGWVFPLPIQLRKYLIYIWIPTSKAFAKVEKSFFSSNSKPAGIAHRMHS